jgi:hypothetical protein
MRRTFRVIESVRAGDADPGTYIRRRRRREVAL